MMTSSIAKMLTISGISISLTLLLIARVSVISADELTAPVQETDGWATASPEQAGLQAEHLHRLLADVQNGTLSNLHGVLIAKDGKLVFEKYFTGIDEIRGGLPGSIVFDKNTLHDMRSVTKSITGALVGIAAESSDLHTGDRVWKYFPELSPAEDSPKYGITIEHLLTMTTGLHWDERTHAYTDPRNSETAMDLSSDSVRYVLGQDLDTEPGTQFAYCGGCTMVLAGIVQQATGKSLDELARKRLFEPLGISDFQWLKHSDGLPIAASGLRLRPRDMAKFGSLYLNGGRWNGRQVIPQPWIEASVEKQIKLDERSAYGYQFWVDIEPLGEQVTTIPVARGNGGQRIYIVQELQLIAVITAGNYNHADSRLSEHAFWRYILPAALSNK